MQKLRLFTLISSLVIAPIAWAQDPDSATTPRETIVGKITESTPVESDNIIELDLRGASIVDTNETIEEITEPEPVVEDIKTEDEPGISEDTAQTLAPFYLSAAEYMELRGAEDNVQMVLNYDIETAGLSPGAESKKQKAELILGAGFASIKVGVSQKIYDFKLKRYLEIKPGVTTDKSGEKTLIFDNVSLYAKTLRRMNTVLKTTKNGKLRKIPVGEDKSLDAFWLENAMSWAAAPLKTDPKVKSDGKQLNVIRDDV